MEQKRKEFLDIAVVVESFSNVLAELQALLDEEQEYYDNVPENLQGGENYQNSEQAVQGMETAISNIEDAMGELENLI